MLVELIDVDVATGDVWLAGHGDAYLAMKHFFPPHASTSPSQVSTFSEREYVTQHGEIQTVLSPVRSNAVLVRCEMVIRCRQEEEGEGAIRRVVILFSYASRLR